MEILETKNTNYYKLDWYVPTEKIDKVYLAINGEIQQGAKLYITTNVVGYEWSETENSKIEKISKDEFIEKANADNIVYFIDSRRGNRLLNYPKELQEVIDIELYRHGFEPHNKVAMRQKLKILNEKHKMKKEWKNFNQER